MKKLIGLCSFLICLVTLTSNSHAQTGKICFIRSTGYKGSAINFKAYIDDSLACKLKNKSYSVHTVNAGDHTVAVSNSGLSNHKKSAPFKVTVQEGKTTYIDIVQANTITAEEVTENTGTQKIKTLIENKNCSTAEAD